MQKNALLLLAIAFLLFSSCNQTTKLTFQNASPNKQVLISINSERNFPLEPWEVKLVVKAYDFKEGSLAFQISAAEMTKDNVKFEWQDNYHCLITFEESDSKLRKFQLRASENQVLLGEVE